MRNQTVKLISCTHPANPVYTAEGLMAYCARVSSPHQDKPEYDKLLRYCMKNGHWSVFEMADMTVEIVTTRAIAQQILRHRSFCFQEFSQRYSENKFGYIETEARRQDHKNRQNSISDLAPADMGWFSFAQKQVFDLAYRLYKEALTRDIAKECARMLLPLNTGTKLYMKGSARSWIHYFLVRCDRSTQQEHREVAYQCLSIFEKQFPLLGELTRKSLNDKETD